MARAPISAWDEVMKNPFNTATRGILAQAIALSLAVSALPVAWSQTGSPTLRAGEPTTLMVEVSGIRDGTDFTRAMGYLQTLAVVKGLRVVRAEADALTLELDLAVGVEGFDRFVAAGSVLARDPVVADGVPTYRLLP